MRTIKITTHWTTEQADDIYLLLDELKTAIWQSYGADIVKMHQKTAREQEEKKAEDGFNDDLLF
ncbi:hypothetical protein [Shewanella sp. T24-MNA-CIBAN-0130]|jgi:hypothetical protein|uniref:hypothetical protein n=1 Tax=Shewanella sp. T24-MNA-CIBAN-0130 TaxID=3140470 RepID=UPI0033276F28